MQSLPRAQQPPHQHQLADVIGIVVGRQQRFAEHRLPVPVGNSRKKVHRFVAHHLAQRFQVAAEGAHAFIPGLLVGRRGFGGPVASGPVGRLVLRVPREFENVPLRNAQVLDQLPRRVLGAARLFAAQLRREILHRVIEGGVGVPALEQKDDLPAQIGVVGGHGLVSLGGGVGCAAAARRFYRTLGAMSAVTKFGKPVAKLVPMPPVVELRGALKGTVLYEGDIISPLDVEWDANKE